MTHPQLFGLGSTPTWLFAPDNYQELPIPVVGYNLKGEPIRQGYPSIIFTWTFINQANLTEILDMYDPTAPQMEIRYISKSTGAITSKWGMVEEPVIGQRSIVYYMNVAMKVTRITETP